MPDQGLIDSIFLSQIRMCTYLQWKHVLDDRHLNPFTSAHWLASGNNFFFLCVAQVLNFKSLYF